MLCCGRPFLRRYVVGWILLPQRLSRWWHRLPNIHFDLYLFPEPFISCLMLLLTVFTSYLLVLSIFMPDLQKKCRHVAFTDPTSLAFGDSYTFVQGTLGHQNYSFIGDAQKYSFTASQLLSDSIVLNQTSAGGPNWVEYLTGCYSGPPLNCKKQLWDFAFAGADVSTA